MHKINYIGDNDTKQMVISTRRYQNILCKQYTVDESRRISYTIYIALNLASFNKQSTLLYNFFSFGMY